MELSVVIPTRNRAVSLARLLTSLSQQPYPLKEVIVVDASDDPPGEERLRQEFPELPLRHRRAAPSVCRQRNLGIRAATAPFVFLCDDDIEVTPSYLPEIMDYWHRHPEAGAVTGLVLQRNESGEWAYRFPPKKFRQLLITFILQTSVWGDLDQIPVTALNRLPLRLLKRFYRRRGNTFSLAGFPLVTDFSAPVLTASVYGLGASVMRREWLLEHPYEERLDPYGIGDNYGIAIAFPQEQPVHVLREIFVYHHQAAENRLPPEVVYFRRMAALRYFMRQSNRFGIFHRVMLRWSLAGNAVWQFLHGRIALAGASLRAMFQETSITS